MEIIGTGAKVSENLLDSGHLVITALLLVIFVLSIWIWMLHRQCQHKDISLQHATDEIRRLTDKIIDMSQDGYAVLGGMSDKINALFWRGNDGD